MRAHRPKISLFIPDLRGGGAERVFVHLARELSDRAYPVQLVVGTLNDAAYLDEMAGKVTLIDLQASRMAFAGLKLIRYLRLEKPAVLLSTRKHANCLAVWAGRCAGVGTRIVVRESNAIAADLSARRPLERVGMAVLMRYYYPKSDRVIAVSRGVAEELGRLIRVPSERISVVYSPLISDAMLALAAKPVAHDWFQDGQPAVVLAVGALTRQKDHATLIRAFARVRRRANARLVILGEGERRPLLEALVARLGLVSDVSLPGFQQNPFAFMSRSKLLVLSSAWEGLPGVLIQALACGCRVVSTDCPYGPREILQGGRLGRLVPVGDDAAMAEAVLACLTLDGEKRFGIEDLRPFTMKFAIDEYLRELLPAELDGQTQA